MNNTTDIRPGLAFMLGDVSQRWRQELDRRLRPLGLTQATWRALFYLERGGDGLTQKALARMIGIEGPSLVHLLNSLERAGLVERRIPPMDRRARSLHLTAAARSVVGEISRVAAQVRGEMLDGISDAELACALSVLTRIRDNAEALGEKS